MKQKIDLMELLSKEYYIVDCNHFTYFARKVRIIGCIGWGTTIEYIIDVPETYSPDTNRKMYLEELEQFKTFKEAQKEAQRLNEIPENKKRKEDYLKSCFSQSYLELTNNKIEDF
jgi:hypothetical protein